MNLDNDLLELKGLMISMQEYLADPPKDLRADELQRLQRQLKLIQDAYSLDKRMAEKIAESFGYLRGHQISFPDYLAGVRSVSARAM